MTQQSTARIYSLDVKSSTAPSSSPCLAAAGLDDVAVAGAGAGAMAVADDGISSPLTTSAPLTELAIAKLNFTALLICFTSVVLCTAGRLRSGLVQVAEDGHKGVYPKHAPRQMIQNP